MNCADKFDKRVIGSQRSRTSSKSVLCENVPNMGHEYCKDARCSSIESGISEEVLDTFP